MSETLNVFWGASLAGRLSQEDKEDFAFQYAPGWLSNPEAAPLSIRLPLRPEPFDDEACRTFFVNLLPEGTTRTLIAKKLGISESNDFGLLAALGGECAGALSLLPEGQAASSQGSYEPLEQEELDKMIERMAQSPLLVAHEDLRLSLAGAQQKLPVLFRDGKFYLPHGSYPSSHILKPKIPGFEGIIENEAFCMRLAAECGLPVPQTTLHKGKHPVYMVERYDRCRDDKGALVRIHQEDFCQALGYSYSKKYESDGGPGLQKCFGLLNEHSTQPALDKGLLLRWTVFNYLIGNCDAHAKNLSMMLNKAEYRLAPFYDLLSTKVYPALSMKFAMRIGKQYRADWMMKTHWERLAEEAGVGTRAVLAICEELGETTPGKAQALARDLIAGFGAETTLNRIVKNIETTSRRMLGIIRPQGPAEGSE
ncbi:MAG: type II toxin-antitoxin system HipA family toxin [Elusimicrobia bacterium]|nr:type II toxin-antitoxin system HipA family toxin [Elusimicrobiota bacterium]